MEQLDQITKHLLWKLYKLGAWGKRHVSESNLPKGFPQHLRHLVKEAAEDLSKKGFLVKHPTHHETQWYLSWSKKKEIEEVIKEFLVQP
ncbi:hypothetical protein HY991_00230 [Candidatus Micrarchaeota archaeon]|nr:hypothetical protein [Candidatus Micrarchaeota archaeon]